MSSFITTDTLYEKEFKESYNNNKFIFIISSVQYGSNGKSYLITYMPETDYSSLFYMVLGVGVVFIENILDNSLRYAKAKICVTLKKEDTFAVIDIHNAGPSIPAEHLTHIFDNFYKDKTGNFGLGLAISKKIISFYHGEIQASNRDAGVSFLIKYPIK